MYDRRATLLLTGLAFGLQILFLAGAWKCNEGFFQDEGYLLETSSRFLLGELPHRDFTTRFMPAANWVLSGFFLALGETVTAMRLYFVLMSAFLAASLQWFSCKLLPRGWALLPTALFLCLGVQVWAMVSFHWDATIFTLLALGLMATRRRLVLAGALCGVSVLYLQSKGLATCLGLGIMLLLEPLPWRQRLRHLGLLVAGAAVPGAAFCLWLAVNGLVTPFFADVVGFTANRYLVLHRTPLDFSPLVQEAQVLAQGLASFGQPDLGAWLNWFWRAASFAAVDFIKFGGYYPVLLVALGIVLWLARQRDWTPTQRAFVALTLVLLFASLFDFGRPNRYRLQFQAPLFNAVLIYLLWLLARTRRSLAYGLTGCVALAYLAHGVDNLQGWSAYRYPVDFPRGRLYFRDPVLAGRLQQLSRVLSEIVPPGTPMYAFPQQNLLPWLQGNPNPSPNIESIPVLHPREDFVRIKRQVEEKKVPFLLFSPLDPRLNGDYPGVRPEDFAREQEWQRQLYAEGYEVALETPELILYRRR